MIHTAAKGFREVFGNVGYCLTALLFAVGSYFCIVVLPQFRTIDFYWSLPVSFVRKIYFVYSVAYGFLVRGEIASVAYTLTISVLFGLNVAAFIYFYRTIHREFDTKALGAGLGGGFFALLGAGCASCGTFMATYVLGLLGAQGFLLWLPFGGMEFGMIGLVGLLISLYVLCKKSTLLGSLEPDTLSAPTYHHTTMLKNFLMRSMLRSKMKDVPAEQQEKMISMIEKNPELFQKIAADIQAKVKGGMDQMAATMEVMRVYQNDLKNLL